MGARYLTSASQLALGMGVLLAATSKSTETCGRYFWRSVLVYFLRWIEFEEP